MEYAIIIEKAGRNYSAYVPDLPGCIATGDTREAVEKEIREAIEFHIRGLREDGIPVPEPTTAVENASARVGVPSNRRTIMANVYVEPRPKGRPEGSHIDDYVVEDHADHVLATFPTQREAIEWARKEGHHPLVARVRNLNDKKKPDHWRAA